MDLPQSNLQEFQSQQHSSLPENVPLPDAPALLDKAFSLYRRQFSKFFPISIVLFLSTLLQSVSLYAKSPALITVTFLFSLIISFLSYLAFILAISSQDVDNQVPASTDMLSFYDKAIGLVGPYSLVAGLILLAIFGGVVLFVIPAFILSVFLSLSTYILIFEHRRGMHVLIRSWYYVEGRWWSFVWRIIFFSVIIFVLSSVIAFIGFIIDVPHGISNVTLHSTSIASSTITEAFNSFLITPLSICYFYYLYLFLKISKEPQIEDKKTKSIRNWILSFIILGTIVLIVGSLFSAAVILKYLPSFIKAAPMTASVVYAPFLR